MDLSCEIVDDYDHIDNDIEYILENVLSEEVQSNINRREEFIHLQQIFNTLLLNKCECCERVQPQCSNCIHGSNYRHDETFQELVLCSSLNIPDLIYECTHMCTCKPEKCKNRLVQFGPRKFLKIVDSAKYRSKGLITTRDIPKGAFICEYAGELLTIHEAKQVLRKNDIEQKMNYVLILKESCLPSYANNNDKEILTIVNPSKKGNIGRYLNHSCEPNCQIVSVRIDCPIPKIAIFSRRYINAGEEICFNYSEGINYSKTENTSNNDKIPCLCGSKNCLQYLPNSDFL
ncbi:probable histone-lysine N-methyltransferase set-23 [Lucilia cuprina]|uniref:probable histone-lysine N-methyltransferase set-23 n=1 Tax=Lucilia cuprina TaxID=7375 RepID=UPI001F068B9D|nr:probable histone-lysine N-methyltransferase set-23 [Lucilia cuprina]